MDGQHEAHHPCPRYDQARLLRARTIGRARSRTSSEVIPSFPGPVNVADTCALSRHPAQQEKESSDSVAKRITVYGLLNALEGIRDREGCILFAMTNNYRVCHWRHVAPGSGLGIRLASKYQCHELDEEMDDQDSPSGTVSSSPSGIFLHHRPPPVWCSSDTASSATESDITRSLRGLRLSPSTRAHAN